MANDEVITVPPALPGRAPVAEHDASGRVRIGRDPDNDIVLDDLRVSRHHAELRRVGNRYQVVDLGSSNGVYYDGQRVLRATLNPGDRISIASNDFIFDGDRLRQYQDTGPLSLTVEDLTVQIKKQVLLDDVSFALKQGSLLGVIGPSGCGKSTMLRAVTGLRPATLGKVMYDGRDLYQNYGELRYRIGMVPQDDVLHRQLSVRRALRFAASVRFADDVPRRQRIKRVDEVIHTLGLEQRAKQRIDTLSGGQRKRTSVALELLTEPSLLLLDEPTSGLDPALDKGVMQELRELADRGRTVVVVTHNVLHLDLCDRVLVMCLGGRMGYFGPPEELLPFFEADDYADVFAKVTDDPDRYAERYRNSDLHRRYVYEEMQAAAERTKAVPPALSAITPEIAQAAAQAMAELAAEKPAAVTAATALAATSAASASAASASASANADGESTASLVLPSQPGPVDAGEADDKPNAAQRRAEAHLLGAAEGLPKVSTTKPSLAGRARHPAAPLRQYATLCLRMLAVIIADKGYALFLLGLPLALALLTHSVPGEYGLAPAPTRFSLEAQRLLVVLVVGAAFLGIAVSIREIVAESSIYQRERAVGLSPGAYLGSKLTVFTLITTIQTVLFVWLSLLGRGGPVISLVIKPPMVEIMVAVALVAVTSVVLGLFISSLARTTEQTTPVLVVIVMAQLVLSGGLFELHGQNILEQVSWIAPTRWGFAAGSSTVDLQKMIPFIDPLWDHTTAAWWRSILIMVGQVVVLIGATRVALRRHEPGRN